jgi:RNA polymerase sigma-70 factor (ECF subfamily)
LRRKSGRKIVTTDLVEEIFSIQADEKSVNNPHEEEVLRKEKFKEVFSLIATLPEELRIPFILRIADEQSYQEIAENLDIPLQTVKNRIFKARQILRSQKGNSL